MAGPRRTSKTSRCCCGRCDYNFLSLRTTRPNKNIPCADCTAQRDMSYSRDTPTMLQPWPFRCRAQLLTFSSCGGLQHAGGRLAWRCSARCTRNRAVPDELQHGTGKICVTPDRWYPREPSCGWTWSHRRETNIGAMLYRRGPTSSPPPTAPQLGRGIDLPPNHLVDGGWASGPAAALMRASIGTAPGPSRQPRRTCGNRRRPEGCHLRSTIRRGTAGWPV